MLNVDLAAEYPIMRPQDEIERTNFQCSVAFRKRLRASTDTTTRDTCMPTTRASGARLPKLEVPTFDGDILKWKSFWDEFSVSIHERSAAAEKVVYLQKALKDRRAKSTIDGLTKSGEHYEEVVKFLQTRYDLPRMVHQTRVCRIV